MQDGYQNRRLDAKRTRLEVGDGAGKKAPTKPVSKPPTKPKEVKPDADK
jgi:hypothetical protein